MVDWQASEAPRSGSAAEHEDGTAAVNSGAELDPQVEARVREHLQPGETFRAAVWVSRADEHSPARLTRAEMSPFRFRGMSSGRRRGHGSPGTLAAGLEQHLRLVTEPRILALTERRLLVLAKGLGSWRDLLPPASGPLPPLRRRWECPRAELTSATERAGRAGRLRLTFTDGSTVTLLTPAAHIQPFLAG